MRKTLRHLLVISVMASMLVSCTGGASLAPGSEGGPTPTLLSNFLPLNGEETNPTPDTSGAKTPSAAQTQAVQPVEDDGRLVVNVDPQRNVHPISPLIYGLSGGDRAYLEALRPTLISWGGNPSTRYNWKLGNAWNAGKDYFYQNGNYGNPDGQSVADNFLKDAQSLGIAARLAAPTLGWVAKDTASCSFPKPDGTCGNADGATCEKPGEIADPAMANTISTPETIAEWIRRLKEIDAVPAYVAMDNEPELWGYTHYDVHPACTTYEEVLDRHLAYAAAIRAVDPEIKIAGPVTCCWFSYWNIAPGPANPGPDDPQDFVAWFLQSVRRHDESSGQRSLDALDVHIYPQGGVYNENSDPDTSARRLRSTRALWDPTYVDESWINEPIYFIPRLQELIDQDYPGLQLGISEWNWGADTSINGALTIADVLGIFGREGVDYAAYWRNPPQDSPGFQAFKLYTNYDDRGGRFAGDSVLADSNQPDIISSYAAFDESSGQLKLMLINKDSDKSVDVHVNLNNFRTAPSAVVYRLTADAPQTISQSDVLVASDTFSISLPAYSASLMILSGQP